MNLEEELNMINNQTVNGEITQRIYEQSSQMASQSFDTQQYAQPIYHLLQLCNNLYLSTVYYSLQIRNKTK